MTNQTTQESVSLAIINYNGRETLAKTINSILAQRIRISDIRLVDNNSTDGSIEFVAAQFPTVALTKLAANHGPNPARNEALRLAQHDCVLIMDNDIVLAPDYVARLLQAHEDDQMAGAITGQIRFHDRPDIVQYNGTYIHYAGEIMLNRAESETPLQVGCVSAGAVLQDRRKVFEVGGFDEDFFIGWEDGDLTFRLALAGYPCYTVSKAVCFHISRPRGQKWIRFQTRNRWWFILKNYDARTFWLALPAIVLLQTCAFIFFAVKGQAVAFGRGLWDALKSLPLVLRKRRAVQALKRVGDGLLLRGEWIDLPIPVGEKSMRYRLVGDIFSGLFRLYWNLIRGLLKKAEGRRQKAEDGIVRN